MVYVECYPDELLVCLLGTPRRNVRHARGKGDLLNKLRKLPVGIGLVDEDPQASQPSELNSYQKAEQTGSLILLRPNDGAYRRLIVICPRLEEWLYQRAAVCGIVPQHFGLPASAHELKKLPRYDQQLKFRGFLEQLCRSDVEVKSLQQWICNFRDC